MPSHVAEVRRALQMLDEYASRIDEELKQFEREQAMADTPAAAESAIQVLGGLSRIAWEAHAKFRQALSSAHALDKATGQ